MNRRELVIGVGGVAASALAGCLGVVGMDEHEATPAGVDPAVREETGYEQTGIEEIVVEESVEVGISEEIRVRNYLTEHEKGIDLGPIGDIQAAAFNLLTSPQISIAGREFNPIAEMSSEELVGLIEADFEGIENVEHVADSEISILEQETVESVFEADAALEAGITIDVNVHVTESVLTSNDHLVAIAVYPEEVQSQEEPNIAAMMDGIVEQAE